MRAFQSDLDFFRALPNPEKLGVVWELCISLRNERAAALRHRGMDAEEAVRRATFSVSERVVEGAKHPLFS